MKYFLLLLAFVSAPALQAQEIVAQSFKIISASTDEFLANELDIDDRFGASLSNIGDFNNDGFEDLVVSAPSRDDGAIDGGAIYILFMDGNRNVKEYKKISATSGNFQGQIENNDRFGFAVTALGDVDKDGTIDLAVSTHYDDINGTDTGSIYILFLNPDASVNHSQKISSVDGGLQTVFPELASFGSALAFMGDIDNDGRPELAVGAYRDNSAFQSKSGSVYILTLNSDGTVYNEQKIALNPGELEYEDYFGEEIENMGDIDGDGIVDMAVSAHRDDDGDINAGAVYILLLTNNKTVKNYRKISQETLNSLNLDGEDLFGTSLSLIEDQNGDGVQDILIGAQKDDDGGMDKGALYLILLKTDGSGLNSYKYSIGHNCLANILQDRDNFGVSVAVLDDLDGDGRSEITVGVYFNDDAGTDKGAIYFFNIGETIQINAGTDQIVCDTNLTTLNASGQGRWVYSPPLSVDDPYQRTAMVSNLQEGENFLVWELNACTADTIKITRENYEFNPVFPGDTSLCTNATLVLDWTGNMGSLTSLTDDLSYVVKNDILTITVESTGVHTLLWNPSGVCQLGDTILITSLEENGRPENFPDDFLVCSEQPAQLNFTSLPDSQWTTLKGSGQISSEENNVIFSGLTGGENEFLYEAGTANCIIRDTLNINRIDDSHIYIGNILTLNHDGKNEVFKVKDLLGETSISLKMLNRWGKVVYISEDYRNDWAPDPEDLSTGAYFYYVRINACNLDYKGWLHILY